jgi:exonuclease VII large subunit
MAVPVTRGELRQELAKFEERFERKLEHKLEQKLDERFAEFERKFDRKLELWGGALLDRIQRVEHNLHADIARFTKAIQESLAQAITVVDEKYQDLPRRVGRLEGKVFPPRRAPKRLRRR